MGWWGRKVGWCSEAGAVRALKYRSARRHRTVRPEPVEGASPHFSPFGLSLSKALLVGSVEGPCLDVSSRVSPRRASHLSCLPKKVDPKKGTPTSAVRLQRTALRCSDFGARAELATRPCGPLRSNSCAKSDHEGAARRAKALRSSTPPTGPEEQHRPHLAAHRLGGRSLRAMRSEPCQFP